MQFIISQFLNNRLIKKILKFFQHQKNMNGHSRHSDQMAKKIFCVFNMKCLYVFHYKLFFLNGRFKTYVKKDILNDLAKIESTKRLLAKNWISKIKQVKISVPFSMISKANPSMLECTRATTMSDVFSIF